MNDTTPILHIYGQSFWHNPVAIVGNREGLIALWQALGLIVGKGQISKANCYVNDGEGFAIVIRQVGLEEVDNLPVPYTDEIASDKTDASPWTKEMKEMLRP